MRTLILLTLTLPAAALADTFGAEARWHGDIGRLSGEANIRMGDVNGDGRADVVNFYRNQWGTGAELADVMVSLSTGSAFANPVRWHGALCTTNETCAVGDFNGDGRDDAVAFTGSTTADVRVALSSGSAFGGATYWHTSFAPSPEQPAVGDVDGDGRDDVISFTRGATNDVKIARSSGSSFGAAATWHTDFCFTGETCLVGDVDGDRRADLIAYTRGAAADAWVALSTGSGFGPRTKYHDWFCLNGEACSVGDANGDGQVDLVTFTRSGSRQAWIGLSRGDDVATSTVWKSGFCDAGQTCLVADVTGDGDGDAIRFVHSTNAAQLADVYVAPGDSNRARTWEIDLNTLYVRTADEDDFWSDGDEPYLMVFGFQSTLDTPGSTRVWWSRSLYELDPGMYDGERVTIPDDMGRLTFPNIARGTATRVGALAIPNSNPTLIGAVVVAMESDASAWSFMRDYVGAQIEDAIEDALVTYVEGSDMFTFAANPDLIDLAVQDVRDSVDIDVWDVILQDPPSVVDADDQIDVTALLYAAMDPAVPLGATIANDDLDAGILRERAFLLGRHPLVFSGNGSTFHVEGLVHAW
ncbi:MAG TPA: FG-GAP-like repeat-containing protein [Myxococcota bacterium]|nr:FG-GAP-like repeat-containing protein [Myxococcota bacterium]